MRIVRIILIFCFVMKSRWWWDACARLRGSPHASKHPGVKGSNQRHLSRVFRTRLSEDFPTWFRCFGYQKPRGFRFRQVVQKLLLNKIKKRWLRGLKKLLPRRVCDQITNQTKFYLFIAKVIIFMVLCPEESRPSHDLSKVSPFLTVFHSNYWNFPLQKVKR